MLSSNSKIYTQFPKYNLPVLFLVFNRLDATTIVFKSIKDIRPIRLYIASDGPRCHVHGDTEKVQAVREFILKNIDWDCEVRTLFQKENIGCGPNIKSSIDWFFSLESKGIILEDDCVPSKSFFYFCADMLDRYENDNRVSMISGTNHLSEQYVSPNDYLFSKYKACWGWATWSRSWVNMDFDMAWRKSNQNHDIVNNMGYSKRSQSHWLNALRLIDEGKVSAWDWQWYFSISSMNQLCIFPKKNLVANIGFGDSATHTKSSKKKCYLKVEELDAPFKHPAYVVPDSQYDKLFEKIKLRHPLAVSIRRKLPNIVIYFIKKYFRR